MKDFVIVPNYEKTITFYNWKAGEEKAMPLLILIFWLDSNDLIY